MAQMEATVAKDKEPLSSRERLNRNIIYACLALGAVIAALFQLAPGEGAAKLFDSSPLPLAVVVPIALVWLVIVPALAWYWHRHAVDEHEAAAYRDGAYYAAYAYLAAAPAWWILWRGGLLPEPNGVAIYLSFTSIWTLVWFRKKYG